MTTLSSAHDRRLLAEAVRQCAESRGGPRPHLAGDDTPSGVDLELWAQLGTGMGLSGLLVPETHGGAGATVADAVAVLTELGATLAPVPALATIGMAGPLLRLCPESGARDELLHGIAAGEAVVTVAWPDLRRDDDGLHALTHTRGRNGSEAVVSGAVDFVFDGSLADVVLLRSMNSDGAAVLAVDLGADGVTRSPMTTLDLTRGMAAIELSSAPARVLAVGPVADAVIEQALDLALVAVSAEQVGIASQCLDQAVAYARDRVQFDRPIGSFQAVKHKLVDLLLDVELARSALDGAAAAADDLLLDPAPQRVDALRAAASMAKAMCSETATRVAAETLHVFGGIGFTWEHDAHLYFRRAKTLEVVLGAPAVHRRRMAAALGVTS